MCVCVCVNVSIHTCTFVCVCVCVCACVRACVYVCVHVHARACVYVVPGEYVLMCECVRACVCACVLIYISISVHVCVHVKIISDFLFYTTQVLSSCTVNNSLIDSLNITQLLKAAFNLTSFSFHKHNTFKFNSNLTILLIITAELI